MPVLMASGGMLLALGLWTISRQKRKQLFRFLGAVIAPGLPEGTVLELTVTKPGEGPVTTNMKITAEDLELIKELSEIMN